MTANAKRHILITGGSSGIGAALAFHYANENTILSLCGTNETRLKDIAHQCKAKGATVHYDCVDVTDKKLLSQWIETSHNISPLDLVIANAGVGLTDQGLDAALRTFDVNMNGVIHTIHTALPLMERNNFHGQIAVISSLAGYIGLPSAPAYSASKNFVRAYGEALRGQYRDTGIQINVICPGFVRSRITDKNTCPMPGFMEADQAASIIANGLKKNKGRITFPWFMVLGVKIMSALPYPIYEWISRLLPDKV